MNRKTFIMLFGFIEASMIEKGDMAIQFEVSIGDYGNSMSTSALPTNSLTASSQPMFDGTKYYYCNWDDGKYLMFCLGYNWTIFRRMDCPSTPVINHLHSTINYAFNLQTESQLTSGVILTIPKIHGTWSTKWITDTLFLMKWLWIRDCNSIHLQVGQFVCCPVNGKIAPTDFTR